jgi:hypothetical protein
MADSTFAPSAEQRGRLLRVMQRQADGTLAPSTSAVFWQQFHQPFTD